jgi:glycosyltransferase involved in cell wall biosynthesis
MSSFFRYAYITAVDISIDNGPGINEREFVKELLDSFGDRIICIIPYPLKPNNYFDRRISYVVNHKGSNVYFYFLYLISTIYRVIKLHWQHRFDALIFRLDLLAIEPVILSNVLKIPFMLKTLAGYTGFSELAGKKQRLISLISLPFYRIATRRALVADTVSKPYIHWQEFKYRLNRNAVHIINNGTILKMFVPSDKSKWRKKFNLTRYKYVIGYVGALSAMRNIDIMIRALPKVKQKEDLALVLVGDGKDSDSIESLVQESGLSANVISIGAVPYTMVSNYMNSFDFAFDLTYVPMKIGDTILNASYSQKIPQYLGCGLPVIAWDIEDNKFIKKERIGELVNVGDEDGLAAAIDYLIGITRVKKNDMSRRARAYAEKAFSISDLAKRRISLWDNSMRFFDQRRN